MQLEEVHGTSKKSGNEFTGYRIKIGEYVTPLFFPSKIELMYIKKYLQKQAQEDFKGDDLNVDSD